MTLTEDQLRTIQHALRCAAGEYRKHATDLAGEQRGLSKHFANMADDADELLETITDEIG